MLPTVFNDRNQYRLYQASNIEFSSTNFSFLQTVDEIGSVPANTSIKVSILVTLKNTRKKRSFAAASVCGMAVLYDYICGSKQTRNLDITLTREYPGRPPLPCGGSSGGRSGGSRGGGGVSCEYSITVYKYITISKQIFFWDVIILGED